MIAFTSWAGRTLVLLAGISFEFLRLHRSGRRQRRQLRGEMEGRDGVLAEGIIEANVAKYVRGAATAWGTIVGITGADGEALGACAHRDRGAAGRSRRQLAKGGGIRGVVKTVGLRSTVVRAHPCARELHFDLGEVKGGGVFGSGLAVERGNVAEDIV